MNSIKINETLVDILVRAANDGFSMTKMKQVPVGASRHTNSSHDISAIVGLVGKTSGAVMINISDAMACFLVGNMLDEVFSDMSPQVLDGICEITNIIAGQAKALLASTEWATGNISCPSVVVGTNYFISHFKGMECISVEFELEELPITTMEDRFFSVSLALLRGHARINSHFEGQS